MAKFLFVLGTDDPSKATRCMQLAKVAAESGHQTDVFLVDDGVVFARKETPQAKAKTGDGVEQYLPFLVDKAVPFHT